MLAAESRVAIVDRDLELERIAAAVRSVPGRLVLVEGPAGIGKTTLLRAARSRPAGRRVLSARGGELERDFSFGVVRQVFAGVMRDPELRARCLDGAGTFAAAPLGLDSAGNGEIGQALHGLYWACANLAEQGPLLVTVDDVQWADEESLRWLHHLSRRVQDLAVVLIVGVRTGEFGVAEALLGSLREEAAEVIVPREFSRFGAGQLITATLGTEGSFAFVRACHEVTGGNPFYLRELLETMRDTGLRPDDGAVESIRQTGPARIVTTMLTRIARCGPDAVALASTIAVLGVYPPPGLVSEIAELTDDRVRAAARRLTAAGILRGTEALDFVHPIVRTTVASAIPAAEEQRLHTAAARALISAGAPADQIAAHLLQIPPDNTPHSVDILLDAAASAMTLGAPERAERCLQRALAESPNAAHRGNILHELGTIARARDSDEGVELFIAALEWTEDPVARARRLDHLVSLWDYRSATGVEDPHLRLIPWIQQTIGDLPEGHAALGLLLEHDLLFAQGLRGAEMEPIFAQLDPLVPSETKAHLLDGRAAAGSWGRREATASAVAADYREVYATKISQLDDLALIPLKRLCDCDQPEVAEEVIARYREALLDRGWSHWGNALAVSEATVALYGRGQTRRALQLLEEAEETSLGEAAVFLAGFGLRVRALVERDQLAEAGACLRALGMPLEGPVELAADRFDHRHLLLIERGLLRGAGDDADGAVEDLLAAGDALREIGFRHAGSVCLGWRAAATVLLARLGRSAEAVALGEESLALAQRWGAPTVLGRCLVALGVAQGSARGLDRVREGVSLLRQSPNGSEYARGLLLLGAELRRDGQRVSAREHLREAAELAGSLGSELTARLAREELRVAGGRVRRHDLNRDELTPAEERVAALAIEERSNRQIAQTLFLSTKTVEMHLSRIFRKLSISSREDLAVALGVSPLDDHGSSTVMFTDIVGSTRLNRQLGDAAWLPILGRHNTLIRGHVHTQRGVVIKATGDGFMLAFSTPIAAARCALAIQQDTQATASTDQRLQIRVGLHTGTPQNVAGDLIGADVNLAARICDHADATEILCSETTAALLAPHPELSLHLASPATLKDFDTQTLYAIRPPQTTPAPVHGPVRAG